MLQCIVFVCYGTVFDTNEFRCRAANVAVKLLQCNFPKIAAQLLFAAVGFRGVGLGVAEIHHKICTPHPLKSFQILPSANLSWIY